MYSLYEQGRIEMINTIKDIVFKISIIVILLFIGIPVLPIIDSKIINENIFIWAYVISIWIFVVLLPDVYKSKK